MVTLARLAVRLEVREFPDQVRRRNSLFCLFQISSSDCWLERRRCRVLVWPVPTAVAELGSRRLERVEVVAVADVDERLAPVVHLLEVLDRLRPDEEPRAGAQPAQGAHLRQRRLRLQPVRVVANQVPQRADGHGQNQNTDSGDGSNQQSEEDIWNKQNNEFADADLVRELADLTRTANRANVTIYSIDPRGLVGGPDLDENLDPTEWQDYVRKSQDSLRVLAEETGGVAVVNQNDFDKALKRIDAETSDYYVLGYYSSNPDPFKRNRQIEVKVAKPGLDIWSRKGYTIKAPPKPKVEKDKK